MLLTIFNLPTNTRYADIKSLIHSKCGFKEVILDNLTQDGSNTKKVTVGLAEEEDAAILVRKINGLFMDGQQLYVETIKKKQASNQHDFYKMTPLELRQQSMHLKKPTSSIMDLGGGSQQPTLQQPYYQQTKYQPNYQLGYSDLQQNDAQAMVIPSVSFGGIYGSTQNTNYGYPQQMPYHSTQQQLMAQSMVTFDQGAPLGFNNQGTNPSVWSDQNDWNLGGNASGGNQISQQSKGSSRWDTPGDSSSRSRRDAPSRDYGRDRGSRNSRREAPRDVGRSAPRRDFGRDAPSRDRGRDAPRDGRRDASYRDRERDAPSRDRGRDRDGPSRDRGRDARNAPARDHARDVPSRKPECSRTPPKRQFSPPSLPYGEHVTNSSQPMRTFSQQRDGPKLNQPWNKQQPKKIKAESNYFPPTKRPKKASFVNQCDKQTVTAPINKNQAQVPISKKNQQNITLGRMAVRSATWRHQVASIFAKEIMNNPNHKNDILPQTFIPELKRAIRYRLETLFGDDHETRMGDMLKIYREKFAVESDTDFFNKVTEEIQKNGSYLADGVIKVEPDDNTPDATGNIKVENEQPEQPDVAKTIPSYPLGNKKINKELKKTSVQIFQDEDTLLSRLKPGMLKALNTEIDEMVTLVAEEFQDAPEPEFKDFHERVKTTVVEDYKKMLKVNLAKRMLNLRPIMLRIFNVPKTISRGKLAPALAKYGVSSLRKSEKRKPAMYYGTCDTYEVHDKLCSMKPIVVEGSTVLIKPFHLTGNREKTPRNNKMNRKQDMVPAKDTADDPMNELEELDEEIDEEIINLNTDYENQDGAEKEGECDNDNSEIIEIDIKQENHETIEIIDDEATNVNVKLECDKPQESIEDASVQNAQGVEAVEIKSTQEDVSEDIEKSNEPSEVETETSTKVENEKIDDRPHETEEIANEISFTENFDFTADVDINEVSVNKDNNAFKIDADPDLDIDKDLSELNPDDLEDFRMKNYDDIDIADLNEDDLEDW